jgi:hypothetical protein
MPNQRLQHDAAQAIASTCLDVIFPCIHPALHKQAWESFYRAAKWGIEDYEIQLGRMNRGLRPMENGGSQ